MSDKSLMTLVIVVAVVTLIFLGGAVMERALNKPAVVSVDEFGGFYTEMRR